MDLHPKVKEALDRRKIHSYHEIVNPKNQNAMKELNVPVEEIKEKFNQAQARFEEIWDKPFIDSLQSLPKLQTYPKVTKCLIAGKEGELIEVSGEKSSGRTCVMIELALQYLKQNPSKNISIINGSSGITKIRFQKLPFQRITYIDVYSLPGLIAAIDQPPEDDIGMIIIDGFLKMVKSIQKPRQQLKAMMLKFKKSSDKIKYVLQNSTVADKTVLDNSKPVLNNSCQYSWIISNVCQNRASSHKVSDTEYMLFLNKSRYGCSQLYQKFKITDFGYEQIN